MSLLKTRLPTLAEVYAPVREDLAVARRILAQELHSDLAIVDRLCRRIHTDPGKMVRPAMLLLSARATGRMAAVHHTLAAVVEMVHMATLVHDDVLDEADTRRRQPTICATDGNIAAVLLGDYLISHAFHLCSSIDDPYASRRIGAATNLVCEGELIQNDLRYGAVVDETIYLDLIRRKTGALTAAACELGARYAGGDADTVASMGEFGLLAGMAFQIVDDVLDLAGDPDQVGKTLDRDLSLGKPTLPVIHCLSAGNAEASAAARAALSAENPCAADSLHRALERVGSIDYALTVAADHVDRATRHLDRLDPGDARDSLRAMAEFILRRRF